MAAGENLMSLPCNVGEFVSSVVVVYVPGVERL
jgi:hypothetical protein